MSLACPDVIAAHSLGLCRPVDNYCERIGPALDAEPVNAITNAAFLIASAAAWRLSSRHAPPRERGLIQTLIVTIAVVGAGSFLFHTVGNRWTEWADVVPIVAFALLYAWLILTLFLAWPPLPKLVTVLLLLLSTVYLEAYAPAPFLWGGALYIPAILTLIAFSITLWRIRPAAGQAMSVAGVVFLCSLTARMADMPLCELWSLGTHFLWHLLNAVLLYLLMRVVILHAPRAVEDPVPG
ncbi:MAG: ceramidase domain-containing protein [Alphaproteobacteria bacterium]|nr:ceramidase domain-containing protein [Alphaproteobacteria bacterium]